MLWADLEFPLPPCGFLWVPLGSLWPSFWLPLGCPLAPGGFLCDAFGSIWADLGLPLATTKSQFLGMAHGARTTTPAHQLEAP